MELIISDMITVFGRYVKKYLMHCNPVHVLFTFCILVGTGGCLRKRKALSWPQVFVYSIYFTFVASITFLGRSMFCTENTMQMQMLFSTYYAWLIEGKYWVIYEVIYNIILFIPLGVILKKHLAASWKAIIMVFLVSIFIEGIQLITGTGLFEICDLIDNSIGGIIGIKIHKLYLTVKKLRMQNI